MHVLFLQAEGIFCIQKWLYELPWRWSVSKTSGMSSETAPFCWHHIVMPHPAFCMPLHTTFTSARRPTKNLAFTSLPLTAALRLGWPVHPATRPPWDRAADKSQTQQPPDGLCHEFGNVSHNIYLSLGLGLTRCVLAV